MSYLNTPRLNFSGRFQADPSTINNNDANFDPTVQFTEVPPNPSDPSNTSVYWNPNGTHNWIFSDCVVQTATTSAGAPVGPGTDPVLGATVQSAGSYPAKLVDLDPDNQGVSQIWGFQFQIAIVDPEDPTTIVASVTGTMPPTPFGDLWNRAMNASQPGMPTMCAVFQSVVGNLTWQNAAASPVLASLQAISPQALSVHFMVDSYQPNSNQSNFTFGRVVGSIGPALATDAPRTAPRRLAPAAFYTPGTPIQPSTTPSIFSTYGPAVAAWDAARCVLILDLGNCVPTDGTPPTSGPSVPDGGWPIIPQQLQLTLAGESAPPTRFKTGAGGPVDLAPPVSLATISVDTSVYLTAAAIVEIPIPTSLVNQLLSCPLTLAPPGSFDIAAQEDSLGRYVDVDVPFFRLNPGDAGQVTLWATRFGEPWSGAQLPVGLLPVGPAGNGGPWNNSDPQSAVALSSNSLVTGAAGTAVLTVQAGNPGTPRTYPNGEPGPDGQVYWITGEWATWGQIFLFAGAPINLLVFSNYPIPAQPTWDSHVGPILSSYARMFPYMKGIIDLGDYDTVVQQAAAIGHVLNLPPTDPHHMPIVRDLSGDKLATINRWLASGMPKS
jgi:hypothetical protein